jgi:hypothetical protein
MPGWMRPPHNAESCNSAAKKEADWFNFQFHRTLPDSSGKLSFCNE